MSGDPYGAAEIIDFHPRCRNAECGKLLAEYIARPWRLRCVRCKEVNQVGDVPPGASVPASNMDSEQVSK